MKVAAEIFEWAKGLKSSKVPAGRFTEDVSIFLLIKLLMLGTWAVPYEWWMLDTSFAVLDIFHNPKKISFFYGNIDGNFRAENKIFVL